MSQFKSDSFLINTTRKGLKEFLSQPSNLKLILPEDRIENWKESDDGCSFKIKGLAEIRLRLEDSDDGEVIYASASDKPFPFKLVVGLGEDQDGGSEINAFFDADVNSFMGAMIKTPLTNFLNALGSAIKNRFA
jgi:hypothetical protein